MEIKLDINNKSFEKSLLGLSEKASDLKSLLPVFTEEIREDLRLRFKSSPSTKTGGEVYGGVHWKELSEGYLRTHPERASGQIYIDTGHFRDQMTINGSAETSSEISGDNEFVFTSNVPYGDKLQKMRPVLFWHKILVEKITDKIKDRLDEK